MNATTRLIVNIGRRTIASVATLQSLLFFTAKIVLRLFNRQSYNSASQMVFVQQLYFTAVQILPLFLLVAFVFGSLVNGMAFQMIKDLGLADFLGRLLMGFVVTEVAPFVTVLLMALRSSSAINAEVAVMKVNRELHTLDAFRIDLIDYLFIPRILSGVLSMIFLSSLFALVVLMIGLLISSLIFNTHVDAYVETLLNSASFSDMVIVIIKCALFGFFITLIPIRRGLGATQELTSIPVAVLSGMVMVFWAIVVIEVLSLILRFI